MEELALRVGWIWGNEDFLLDYPWLREDYERFFVLIPR